MKKYLLIFLLIGIGIGAYLTRSTWMGFWAGDDLVITFNTPATDISPYGLDLDNVTRTANIYQGLVALDRNLNVIPLLAVSWGNISERQWEFRLREGVFFHDGSPFSAEDVIRSYNEAQSSNSPGLTPLLETIDSIEAITDDKIKITTKTPDPLLLSKLSQLFIHRGSGIGTGPYRLTKWSAGEHLELHYFEDYWGSQPDFSSVIYQVESDRTERQNDFEANQIDILATLTPDQVDSIDSHEVKTGYGLEVVFLMFKLDDLIFEDKSMREVVQHLIDPNVIVSIGNNLVRPATQFVAQGVFGYNESIPAYDYDPANTPRNLFGVRLEPVELYYLSSFRTLADYLTVELGKAGFKVSAIETSTEELLAKVEANEPQLYLLGWRAEDGDAGSFFEAFAHQDGPYNEGRYQNEALNELIEAARGEMDNSARLNLLKEAGQLLSEDLIGIPLFETARIYGVQDKIDWEPRLDGLILASEVGKK